MRDFIKKIWNGQVSPIEKWMESTGEVLELEGLIVRHKDQLNKILDENGKAILEKLADCEIEHDSLIMEEAFICGVRFAVQFLVGAIE